MKASRFLEELPPADPELFERWELDDPGAGPPTLTAAPVFASLPGVRDARVIPVLFGKVPRDDDRDGGDDVPF
jgi:DNA helicase-2/ATP-dependent DNA helicase PcrA